jgi:hypothetical protein
MSQEEKKKVDEEWKKEVQREKAKLAQETESKKEGGQPLPQANFALFISGLATEVLIYLGEVENPLTKKKEKNLQRAKYSIDLLSIIEEKTRGNLSDQEKTLLEQVLYDLRMRFVTASEKPKKTPLEKGAL